LRKKRRSLRPRLLPRIPKANERKGKACLLHILRRRSNPNFSCPNLRPKKKATQKIQALIPKE